jgi:hypothetical protein
MERMSGTEPFQYPEQPHCRKHGPAGYSDYADYKDWLRDEFDFRCVYCLRREVWERRRAIWVVEHLIPRKERPDLATEYTNLVLACTTCNSFKSASGHMPNPCKLAYGKLVSVSCDGTIIHHSREGLKLIRIAGLADDDSTKWRRREIAINRNLKKNEPEEYRRSMAFPSDLPDLAKRRVRHNRKPNGAKNCRFEQRSAGTLPETY